MQYNSGRMVELDDGITYNEIYIIYKNINRHIKNGKKENAFNVTNCRI